MRLDTPALKLYGERNTGTNYLRALIERNLQARVLPGTTPTQVKRLQRLVRRKDAVPDAWFAVTGWWNLGWKHAEAPSPEALRRTLGGWCVRGFVALVKNPYAWLLSLQRNPYHRAGGPVELSTLIRAPWVTVGRERGPARYPNPVQMWNAKVRSYLPLVDAVDCALMRYEDLLRDGEATVTDLAERFHLAHRTRHFQNIERSTKGQPQTFDDYRRYYLEERWRGELSPEDVAFIAGELDHDLVRQLDYDVLD